MLSGVQSRPRDVPLTMREHQTARALLLPVVLALCAIAMIVALRPALRDRGLGDAATWSVTISGVAVAIATLVYVARWAASSWWTETTPPDSRAAAAGLGTSIGAALVLPGAIGLGFPTVAALAAASGAAAGTFVAARTSAIAARGSLANEVLGLWHPRQAEEFVSARRAELQDPSTTDPEVVRVAMVSGLAIVARLVERPELLPEALRELQRCRHAVHPSWMINAVLDLVAPMAQEARRSERGAELEEALELLTEVIADAPGALRAVRIMLFAARADGLLALHAIAEAAGHEPQAQRLQEAAIDDRQRALSITRRGSRARAVQTLELVMTNWNHPSGGGLDVAIDRCRGTMRQLRARRSASWERACMTLVDLLGERSLTDNARARVDLVDAVRLCELVARSGRRQPHEALARLPLVHDELDADVAVIGAAFRRAFDAVATRSLLSGVELATDWACWAVDRGCAGEAAEAHWCLMRARLCQSRHERLRSGGEPVLSDTQEVTAQAAFWLLAAGRACDAAVALDLGRAIQLSERFHLPGGKSLEERLADVDRYDLLDGWLEAVGQPSSNRRPADDRRVVPPEGTIVRVGRQRFRLGFAPDDYLALAAHERQLSEIGRLPGFEDVHVASTYEDLRDAALDGPLVYLAATHDGGYAVIVTSDGDTPTVVALPGMTSDDLAHHARRLTSGLMLMQGVEELNDALRWLGRYVIAPLRPATEPGALATLMPVGTLNVLPLHAAGIGRGGDGPVFRYAPYGRALRRAQQAARGFAGPELAILSVDVSRSIGDELLWDESRRVAEMFARADVAERRAAASAEAVLVALDEAPTWHLACRAEHDRVLPLSSEIALADGPLSIRTLRDHEHRIQRLAVLSSCWSTAPDDDVLDEGVQLATALLQCGVAGAVAPEGTVEPHAAKLLVLRFFQQYLEGQTAPRALAAAQSWLATATNGEVQDAFGALHPAPVADLRVERDRWRREPAVTDPRGWALYCYAGA